jgi:hypothetical protein
MSKALDKLIEVLASRRDFFDEQPPLSGDINEASANAFREAIAMVKEIREGSATPTPLQVGALVEVYCDWKKGARWESSKGLFKFLEKRVGVVVEFETEEIAIVKFRATARPRVSNLDEEATAVGEILVPTCFLRVIAPVVGIPRQLTQVADYIWKITGKIPFCEDLYCDIREAASQLHEECVALSLDCNRSFRR